MSEKSRNVGCRNYVIEKRNASSRQWERASGCVSSEVTQFKVSRLDEGQTYQLRVCAENDQGCGPALTTPFETTTNDPFGNLHTSCFLSFAFSFEMPCLCRRCLLAIGDYWNNLSGSEKPVRLYFFTTFGFRLLSCSTYLQCMCKY